MVCCQEHVGQVLRGWSSIPPVQLNSGTLPFGTLHLQPDRRKPRDETEEVQEPCNIGFVMWSRDYQDAIVSGWLFAFWARSIEAVRTMEVVRRLIIFFPRLTRAIPPHLTSFLTLIILLFIRGLSFTGTFPKPRFILLHTTSRTPYSTQY